MVHFKELQPHAVSTQNSQRLKRVTRVLSSISKSGRVVFGERNR